MPANTARRYREFARDTHDESPASFAIPSPRTMTYFACSTSCRADEKAQFPALRYRIGAHAAELAEPADSEMKVVARDAEDLQTLLGEHWMPLSPPTSSPRSVLMATGQRGPDSLTEFLMANELNRAAQIRASLRN